VFTQEQCVNQTLAKVIWAYNGWGRSIERHEVVGSDGALTGYSGGIWRKKWLLEHEQGCEQQSLF